MSDLEGRESPEMYLKTIYLIWKEKGYCRAVDIARRALRSRHTGAYLFGGSQMIRFIFRKKTH